MRMLRCAVATALVLACGAAPAIAAPTIVERAAVDRGRSLGRALLVLRNPRVCAPVVLATRCERDLAGMFGDRDGNAILGAAPHARAKPYDGLRAFIRDGDPATLDPTLSYINMQTPADEKNAHLRVLIDGGINSVLFSAANGNVAAQMLSSGAALDAASTATDADAGYFGSAETLRRFASIPVTHEHGDIRRDMTHDLPALVAMQATFADAIETRFTSTPEIAPDDETTLGSFRLGIAVATFNELLESELAPVPDERAYSHEVMRRLVARDPALAQDAKAVLADATARDPAVRHRATIRMNTAFPPFVKTLSHERVAPFVLGELITQLGYNAAAFRDVPFAGTIRAIPQLTTAGLPPALVQRIDVFAACATSDLACQRRAAIDVVEAAR